MWLPRLQAPAAAQKTDPANASAPVPAGMVAQGAVAHILLARLEEYEAADLQRISATACRDFLVLICPPDLLPWVDGVRYCAPDANAPGLWLPTHLAPQMATDLLLAALRRRIDSAPLLLWHAPEQILPLNEALNLTPAILQWLKNAL